MHATITHEYLCDLFKDNESIRRYNVGKHLEFDHLAHALVDINEICLKLTTVEFPRLMKENITENEVKGILSDVRMELEHFLYHIVDARYFEARDIIERTLEQNSSAMKADLE